ncbi:MAG: hypothetical protein AAF570_21035, partial [Bacteroidota bacterium]
MRKISLFILFWSFLASGAFAQWSYTTTYVPNTGNPGALNTQGDAPGLFGWSVLVPGPQNANLWSTPVAIPFAFDFFGNPVTHLIASQNGLVSFDTSATALPNVNTNLPGGTLPNNTICGFWDEFTASPPTNAGDDIRIDTFGTAPNQQFWIKWYSFEMGNPANSFNYFAVVLEETSNKIYVVDMNSSATNPFTGTVGVQLNGSTAVQFGDSTLANNGNSSSATDNDYYEFCPVFVQPDDAGVSAFINPTIPGAIGSNPVSVTVTNFGLNAINSVTVNWSLNGALQPPVPYGTTIASGASATVSLGTAVLGAADTLCAWTSGPNGNTDPNPNNDTTCMAWCPALSGVYSVGGAGADYAEVSEAVADLLACGVAGPVTFQIAP